MGATDRGKVDKVLRNVELRFSGIFAGKTFLSFCCSCVFVCKEVSLGNKMINLTGMR